MLLMIMLPSKLPDFPANVTAIIAAGIVANVAADIVANVNTNISAYCASGAGISAA